MQIFDVFGGVDVGVVGDKTDLSKGQIVVVVGVIAKIFVLNFTEYYLLDDLLLTERVDLPNGHSEVVMRSVFRCLYGWHTSQVVH